MEMQATKLIERLQEIVNEHGDMSVSLLLEEDTDNLGQVAFSEISCGERYAKHIVLYGEDAWDNR